MALADTSLGGDQLVRDDLLLSDAHELSLRQAGKLPHLLDEARAPHGRVTVFNGAVGAARFRERQFRYGGHAGDASLAGAKLVCPRNGGDVGDGEYARDGGLGRPAFGRRAPHGPGR